MRSALHMRRRGDALALAVLLVIAILPVRGQLFGSPKEPPSAEARMRSAREIENRRAETDVAMPAWDPYQFGGRPYLADFDTRVMYLPNLLLRFAPIDLSFALSFVFHAWLAGVGAYLVARRLEITPLASLLGAIAVVLATVAAPGIDIVHSVEAHRLAWLPLVIALAMRSTGRPSRWPHPGLVVSMGMVLLTSSARMTVYAFGAVTAWYLYTLIWPLDRVVGPRRLLVQLATLSCLAVGLSAFQTLPAVRLWLTAGRAGGLSVHDWTEGFGSVTAKPLMPEDVASALLPLRGHRTLSVCPQAVDEADLLALRIPSVGGAGGVLLGDYARFVNIASGLYPEKMAVYEGIKGAGGAPTRPDLLRFLGVEYLISCEGPDPEQWAPVSLVRGIGVYRNLHPFGRAVWTCPAQQVGREELEYRLRRYRYDASLTLRGAGPLIYVRWVPDVREDVRIRTEAEFRILSERFLGDRTWQYELFDTSPENVGRIVTHPLVEDTHGVDRNNFALTLAVPDFSAEAKTEWLIGAEPCTETRPATVLIADQSDGHVAAEVDAVRDGLVFFSETYYPLRTARVDGERVTPKKVNFGFTGVPVPVGKHRVELRYDPRGFQVGLGLSLVTLLIWLGGEWRGRSVRPAETAPRHPR